MRLSAPDHEASRCVESTIQGEGFVPVGTDVRIRKADEGSCYALEGSLIGAPADLEGYEAGRARQRARRSMGRT